MAQDDSRWQDLMKMQDTANSATNPASDQPSGQFNAEDIEFESFMFDPGTGPLPTLGSLNTDPNMGVVTAVNPLAANLAAHTGGTGPLGGGQSAVQTPAQPAQPAPPAAPGFDFTGQDVPLPSFLAGVESQAQQQAEPEPLFQPYQSALHAEQGYEQQQTPPPITPRGTGPLGSQHSSSNLAARLSQLQGQQGTEGAPGTTMPRGTGPLGMRRGTGPLGGMPSTGTGPLRTPAAASTAGPQAESESMQPSPAGPINPAYFKSPTGPLGQRIRTGPLTPTTLHSEPEETLAVPAPATPYAAASTYTEQTQNDPTTWNDTTLGSVEDFSQVLLALYGLPANLPPMIAEAPATMAAMSAGTSVQERPESTQEWAGLPFENAYSASAGPALAEPAVAGPEESLVPGWGEMTGAPPENNYTSTLDEVAAPGYDGPQLDYVVPLDEAEAHAQAPETVVGGTSAGDALEFDSFMFDDGHPSQLLDPSVLESQQPAQPAPTASGVDSYLQPQDEFDMEPLQYGAAPAETQAEAGPAEALEATQAEAEMEPAAEDAGQGPLPFWLQDTSDLEVLARQGYVDMDLGAGTQDAAEGETLPMQAVEPLAPPEPVQFEQEALVATPEELTGETAEDDAEPAFAAPAGLESAAEEGFTQADDFDVAPFDASMLAPTAEAEAPVDVEELELAPTFQAETYAEPQAELEAAPAMELEAEPAVAVEAQAEASSDEPHYEELPPIEPFDFTSLGLAPEEDAYGFNTEELLGVLPSNRDPMRATANLDVLADIFDGAPVGSAEDMTAFNTAAALDAAQTTPNAPRTPTSPALSQLTSPIASFLEPEEDVEQTATQSQLQAQLRAQMEAQAQAPTLPEPQAEVEPVEPTQPAEPVAPQPARRETGRLGGGWTSAVTTTLSMGGIDDDLDMMGGEAQETGLLFEPPLVEPVAPQPVAPQPGAPQPVATQPVAPQPVAPEPLFPEPVAEPVAAAQEAAPDPDFDIEPFDYSQLRLEEEQEIPTGMLDPRKARRPGTTGELISPDLGGSLWSERPAAPAEEPEDDEESWQGTERDTSLFMSTSRPASDRGKSTGWLTDDTSTVDEAARPAAAMPATPTPAPAPEPAATPEPTVEAQPPTTTGRGRKKAAADDSSAVKARVSWADATSPGLPTLPDSLDLQGMTTGPLGDEEPEAEDVEATSAQGSKQTHALKPTPEMAPEPTPEEALETPSAPEPKRSRGRAAAAAASTAPAPQAAPVETPAEEPVQEVDTVEEAAPVSAAPTPAVPSTPSVAPAPTPVPTQVPEYIYQPMQGQQEATNVEMPKVGDGRSMYTSGPLPELEGFEALRQLVEANPDDIGAHMALAAGYSQLGDISTTLRVYRRVLRKRNVPAMFLSLIAEELNDYEREMQGDAHYHQVRGDLYMKQGRHQEAIQEYNKIK